MCCAAQAQAVWGYSDCRCWLLGSRGPDDRARRARTKILGPDPLRKACACHPQRPGQFCAGVVAPAGEARAGFVHRQARGGHIRLGPKLRHHRCVSRQRCASRRTRWIGHSPRQVPVVTLGEVPTDPACLCNRAYRNLLFPKSTHHHARQCTPSGTLHTLQQPHAKEIRRRQPRLRHCRLSGGLDPGRAAVGSRRCTTLAPPVR